MAICKSKLLAVFACAIVMFLNGAVGQKTYVDAKTVNCSSTGIDFHLSLDAAQSELFKETQLNVELFTGDPFAPVKAGDFDPKTGEVKLDYAAYQVVASIVYGADARPLQYAIEQPFYAVPSSHKGRNYTFAVYCIIQAYAYVNVSTNTSDQGHGDHGGDVVNPTDHITARLQGLQQDGSSTLGDPLDFALALKDDKYSSLIPVTCRYYDPNDAKKNMILVADKCPIPFSQDQYFSPMKRIDTGSYRLDFKAFSFETTASSFLAIECDVQLCISTNVKDCQKDCWGGTPTGPTEAPTTGPTEATTTGPTEATTTGPTEATTTGPSEATTTGPSEATTTEGPTEAPTSEGSTESTSTEAPTEAPTARPARKRRSVKGTINEKAPTSVTIKEKQQLKVNPKPAGSGAASNQFASNILFCIASLATLRFWF